MKRKRKKYLVVGETRFSPFTGQVRFHIYKREVNKVALLPAREEGGHLLALSHSGSSTSSYFWPSESYPIRSDCERNGRNIQPLHGNWNVFFFHREIEVPPYGNWGVFFFHRGVEFLSVSDFRNHVQIPLRHPTFALCDGKAHCGHHNLVPLSFQPVFFLS